MIHPEEKLLSIYGSIKLEIFYFHNKTVGEADILILKGRDWKE